MKTIEEKAKHKLQQLNEAHSMLEDIEWRVCWALDFSEYSSINEALTPAVEQISNALEEIEMMKEQLEEEIESYKTDKQNNEDEFDNNASLKYCLD